MNRLLLFKLLFTVITLTLLIFQIVIWKKISPAVQKLRFGKVIRGIYFAMVFAGQSVLWVAVFYPGRGITATFPEWYEPIHRVILAINYSHFFWVLPLGALWLAGILVRRLAKFVRRSDTTVPATPVELADQVSRADFFRKAFGAAAVGINFLPSATTAVAISGMFLGSRQIWVNEKEVRIANLHDDLKGLRFVQISDIHIGNLIGEKYLNFTLGLIRAAKPDYVLVTGDIIDNNNAFLPVAGTFFSLLDAMLPPSTGLRAGGRVFGVLGNHDYIDDGRAAAKAFRTSGLNILHNEAVTLSRGRGKFSLGGLDYPPLGKSRMTAMQTYFETMRASAQKDLPLLLMNHHPSDFEYLKTQKVDLVLSGHTHGGQISFSSRRDSLLNGASWGYRYYVDLYNEQGSQLYVNRGLGHWFPLRISCPPEITVITLT